MRAAFLGLGIMGLPMARNAARAGHEITAYNRTEHDFRELTQAGGKIVDSAAEAVADAEVVVVMLTGPEACDAVLLGPDGAGKALSGKLVVNMSTVPPAYTKTLAERLAAIGARFIDAPVSGSRQPAEEGTLVILAGGASDDVAAAEPVLSALGSKVVRCGPVGMGATMKLCVNLTLGTMAEGLAEGVELARSGGLSAETFLDVVLAGPLGNKLFAMKRPLLVSGDFAPQFPLKHMAKDLGFVVNMATETGADIPLGRANAELYRRAVEDGHGDIDFAGILSARK